MESSRSSRPGNALVEIFPARFLLRTRLGNSPMSPSPCPTRVLTLLPETPRSIALRSDSASTSGPRRSFLATRATRASPSHRAHSATSSTSRPKHPAATSLVCRLPYPLRPDGPSNTRESFVAATAAASRLPMPTRPPTNFVRRSAFQKARAVPSPRNATPLVFQSIRTRAAGLLRLPRRMRRWKAFGRNSLRFRARHVNFAHGQNCRAPAAFLPQLSAPELTEIGSNRFPGGSFEAWNYVLRNEVTAMQYFLSNL